MAAFHHGGRRAREGLRARRPTKDREPQERGKHDYGSKADPSAGGERKGLRLPPLNVGGRDLPPVDDKGFDLVADLRGGGICNQKFQGCCAGRRGSGASSSAFLWWEVGWPSSSLRQTTRAGTIRTHSWAFLSKARVPFEYGATYKIWQDSSGVSSRFCIMTNSAETPGAVSWHYPIEVCHKT